ncbi:Sec-independent protein translocase subunit TatA [Arthrobacter sp. I2-34]|uniref:Sec-independent protein translocase protein TatA n=1 Tax=Arthrobacter hankyongi TaxID=2904801 RepID=A0ABS9L659_9MICC|nr:Sec-independent protein translocase subunit TatA [Arthrobacter hankyongi]MCG2622149.1 Sec-independent protein translocase subunit TatA [Arthrobacter hankyongi]
MGRLFESPTTIIILVIVVILLFGAPKLPGLARSVGQSLRIFKSEVKQMKDDDPSAPAPDQPVEGRVVNPPQNVRNEEQAPNANGGTKPPSQQ